MIICKMCLHAKGIKTHKVPSFMFEVTRRERLQACEVSLTP
jgi:hypothetical protein